MANSKVNKLVLDDYGSYLGMEKGCFTVKDKNGEVERYPLFEKEIGEVVLKSGNSISTGALASLGFWDIDVLVLTQRGRPVAMLKSFDDDSHVETRLCQYEAYGNDKGICIAKQLVKSRIEGQDIVLRKYGLRAHDLLGAKKRIDKVEAESLVALRRKLTGIEGKATKHYFKHIFQLIPDTLRPDRRRAFKAYDGVNNIFNLAYEMLSWKVYRAIVKAKLEPFLGFLHSLQHGKPSLVCDLQELYRHLVDDFLVQYCRKLKKKDFATKTESVSRKRKGKREYLNEGQTRHLMKQLNAFFETIVDVPRIRIGGTQTIETLINEEAFLFAKFLRNEREVWTPRIAVRQKQ